MPKAGVIYQKETSFLLRLVPSCVILVVRQHMDCFVVLPSIQKPD